MYCFSITNEFNRFISSHDKIIRGTFIMTNNYTYELILEKNEHGISSRFSILYLKKKKKYKPEGKF